MEITKLTVDNKLPLLPRAAATWEKCFSVKKREKGAPLPSP